MALIERLRHHAAHPAYHPYGPIFAEAAEAIRDRDAEIERLRKDAARYRWLRGDVPSHSLRWGRWEVRYWTGRYWDDMRKDGLDAAIDAAMEVE